MILRFLCSDVVHQFSCAQQQIPGEGLQKNGKSYEDEEIGTHYQGHTNAETGVSGLVLEDQHTEEHTKATATVSHAKEHRLGDASGGFLRRVLISKHKCNACGIDYNQIKR